MPGPWCEIRDGVRPVRELSASFRRIDERSFEVVVTNGVLRGHSRGHAGPWALVLHGGPGLPDYMAGCAAEVGELFSTIRYTQRGTPPSDVVGPYSVEAHVDDARAVLDTLAVDQAWLIGHSWGGHLALHLAVTHPERVAGVICLSTLGAFPDIFPEFRSNLIRGLPQQQRERVVALRELASSGRASESDRVEELSIVWSQYFADPDGAGDIPIERFGVEGGSQTGDSIAHHFERQTLSRALPDLAVPVLFVHGDVDPLPARASIDTAVLVPQSEVVLIPECGHFPWIEAPGAVRDAISGWIASNER